MIPTGRFRILREKYGSGLYLDTLQEKVTIEVTEEYENCKVTKQSTTWRNVPIVEVTVEQTIWNEENGKK